MFLVIHLLGSYFIFLLVCEGDGGGAGQRQSEEVRYVMLNLKNLSVCSAFISAVPARRFVWAAG